MEPAWKTKKQNKPFATKPDEKIYGVYILSMLTMKVVLRISEVGKNIKPNLEKTISKNTEGKCIKEGYIQPGSVRVLTYSSGNINGDKIEFQTVFECMVCHPVEGMLVECMTKTVTKAGIHAEVVDKNGNIPILVFIARDHHYKNKMFSGINENMKILVSIIGVRFELNDPYICVIGKLSGGTGAITGRGEDMNRGKKTSAGRGLYEDVEDDEDDN
jgi:DNA-directed RNA polymerase subunit E'/Rpb7